MVFLISKDLVIQNDTRIRIRDGVTALNLVFLETNRSLYRLRIRKRMHRQCMAQIPVEKQTKQQQSCCQSDVCCQVSL